MRILILLSLIFSVNSAFANIVVNGTRVIYPASNKETIVQLINNGNDPALVQSWIDDGDINSTPETANVPFLLSPPVIKVSGNAGQQLRIKKLPSSLPTDRESIFYLNVLDIPPTPDNLQGQNTMQLAIKTRIKLFYRPTNLQSISENAISTVEAKVENQGFRLTNTSPFYITIANINDDKGQKVLSESLMIAPFSNVFAPAKSPVKQGKTYSLLYVDDFGAYKDKSIVAL
ncbi:MULTISPECIES: fimbrial biogenesis chaperone [unclassified Providencia]|uniref:fimbrial biogenesis chaperone n=1 Tax=unclassified Providencia TaxID=2633465 RepID=UPI000E93F3DE|nr:molecular chaperone [Providencia sp.]MBP6082399.1 molecular chaperone [Providencia sp.]HBO23434.1 pilus assembly protein [Providencia sp.]